MLLSPESILGADHHWSAQSSETLITCGNAEHTREEGFPHSHRTPATSVETLGGESLTGTHLPTTRLLSRPPSHQSLQTSHPDACRGLDRGWISPSVCWRMESENRARLWVPGPGGELSSDEHGPLELTVLLGRKMGRAV